MAEFRSISNKEFELIKNVTPEECNEFIRIGPKNYLERSWYKTYYNEIKNFEVREDDVWVVTLPRSGTTLTQEMVWQICNGININNTLSLIERYTYFELPVYTPQALFEATKVRYKDSPQHIEELKRLEVFPWVYLKNIPGPRYFKTHLPLSLLPKNLLTSGCKIIYVARNPKDMLVSRYNFTFIYGEEPAKSFEGFWNLLEKDLLTLTPYWTHIEEAWQLRHQKNFLFLFYENIVQNTTDTIKETTKFFNKQYPEEEIKKLGDHLKIENFKKNPSLNKDYQDYFGNKNCEWKFVRKGKVDGWKDELFTEELSERADKWIQENFKKTTLRFPNIK